MTALIEKLDRIIYSERSSVNQYTIISLVLNNYPLYEDLGQCAMAHCERLAAANGHFYRMTECAESQQCMVRFSNLHIQKSFSFDDSAHSDALTESEDLLDAPECAVSYSSPQAAKIREFIEALWSGEPLEQAIQSASLGSSSLPRQTP